MFNAAVAAALGVFADRVKLRDTIRHDTTRSLMKYLFCFALCSQQDFIVYITPSINEDKWD